MRLPDPGARVMQEFLSRSLLSPILSVSPSLYLFLSFFLVRSFRVRAGRSAGTPEIMFGRTAQHRREEQRGKVKAGEGKREEEPEEGTKS